MMLVTGAFLISSAPIVVSALTVTNPPIMKVVHHKIATTKTIPPKKVPVKKVVTKKKLAPKHKRVPKKHKPFLMINAPLLDPNNPPSSPKPEG